MKYVIIKRTGASILIAYPVLFPDALNHCDMVPEGNWTAISAGSCEIIDGRIAVDMNSHSESLKLKPVWQDPIHIASWITYGESMLVMASAIYDEPEPSKKKTGRGKKKG